MHSCEDSAHRRLLAGSRETRERSLGARHHLRGHLEVEFPVVEEEVQYGRSRLADNGMGAPGYEGSGVVLVTSGSQFGST